MPSPMIVRLPAVAVVVAVALLMAAAMAVALPLRCATTRAMVGLARQPLPPCVLRPQPQWWRKSPLNQLLKRPPPLPRSPRCLQAAPVVVVQRPADRAKILLILLISPIGSTESVGLLVLGWS